MEFFWNSQARVKSRDNMTDIGMDQSRLFLTNTLA